MIDFVSLTRDQDEKDTLDALYYAARFIKQAARIKHEYKDIFAEDTRSAPSAKARELCLALIAAVEADAGAKAANFDDETAARVLRDLTKARFSLNVQYSLAEQMGAESAIQSMIAPEIAKRH